MGIKKLHLYIGLNKQLTDMQIDSIVQIVQNRHPTALKGAVLDGYWSGVEESTLLYKVETTMEYLLETVDAIDRVCPGMFIAIDEPDN